MAVRCYRCKGCGAGKRLLGDKPAPECCGAVMERNAAGPGTAVMETLDNGAMTRSLTRYADAERLHAERRDAADSLAGGATRVER